MSVPVPSGYCFLSFGLVADTHYGDFDDTDRPRFFRSSLPNLGETAEMFEEEKVDFAVHLGDVIQESHSRTTSLSWLAAMDQQFRNYTGERQYLMGNHDLGDLSKAEFMAATSGSSKAPNYFFDRGGFRFIVIDANYRQDGVSYDRGNFSWTNSFVPERQVLWLSKTIDRARALGSSSVPGVERRRIPGSPISPSAGAAIRSRSAPSPVGAPAKYNRLLEIEAAMGWPLANAPAI